MQRLHDLIGKPFEDGGRGPDSYDCWGLTREVFRRFNVELPDYNISAFACSKVGRVIGKEVEKAFSAIGDWEALSEPQVPSLVVIRNHPKFKNHCGVYIGNGRFIHTLEKTNCIISRINEPLWRKKIVGFFRYKKG